MTTTVLKHLTFGGFTVKDADKGEIEAKVATLEVVDKDGDIIRKSALPKAATVAMSAWGHDSVFGARPAGSGKLKTEGRHLVFDGRAFLTTWAGKETFETLKQYPEAEWSFGFRITGWEDPDEDERKAGAWRVITKMEAFEVSPVLIGAGLDTGTRALKSESATLSPELSAAIRAEVRSVMAELKAAEEPAVEIVPEPEVVVEPEPPAATVTDPDPELEAARLAVEQAAADAKATVEAETKAQQRIADTAQREFERFKRTMARVA
jgi:phage head maturation protease